MDINDNKYLEIIIGPMFSGKTSKLLNIAKMHTLMNRNVILCNHSLDNRYSLENLVSTHDGITGECISISNLSELEKNYKEKFEAAHTICVNEAQFFGDLYETVIKWVELYNKHVAICGLDGDYERKKFGSILDLIPYSDECKKIKAICTLCSKGKKAMFTLRKDIKNNNSQILVGSSESYLPACRSCYIQNLE